MLTTLQTGNRITFSYQFFMQNGTTARDLSAYDTVSLLLHPPTGDSPIVVDANFVSKPNGTVTLENYRVTIPGSEWEAQFVASIGAYDLDNEDMVYGVRQPLPTVVANLDS